MTVIKVLVTPADPEQPLRIEEVEVNDIEHYNRLVGGYLESLNIDGPPCTIYMNEEGKVHQLPINDRATALLYVHNPVFIDQDVIVGDAIITGPPDRQANDTDVPAELIDLLMHTEVYRIEAQVTEGGPWLVVPGTFTAWLRAYQHAIYAMKTWSVVDAVRVVPAT